MQYGKGSWLKSKHGISHLGLQPATGYGTSGLRAITLPILLNWKGKLNKPAEEWHK
jgi:hypothetical protein